MGILLNQYQFCFLEIPHLMLLNSSINFVSSVLHFKDPWWTTWWRTEETESPEMAICAFAASILDTYRWSAVYLKYRFNAKHISARMLSDQPKHVELSENSVSSNTLVNHHFPIRNCHLCGVYSFVRPKYITSSWLDGCIPFVSHYYSYSIPTSTPWNPIEYPIKSHVVHIVESEKVLMFEG